jgi:hypothetical protein
MDKATGGAGRAGLKPRRAPAVMVWARKLHLYLGVVLAPSILFFAVTGLLQVYSLHEDHGSYRAPPALMHMAQLHKKQSFALRHAPKPPTDRGGPAKGEGAVPHDKPAPALGQTLLKAFSAITALGLISLTLLGLYMAYVLGRNVWLVNSLLAAGFVVPIALIFGLGA